MSPVEAGLVGCLLLLLLLMSSMPVAFAMAAVGFVGFAIIVSPGAALSMVTTDLYETFSSYSLTVIPLFVFMGQIAFHAGISRRLFNAAYHWLGPLPGGLAMATVGACTGFGAICGSGPATAATMASVALPEMRRYKYDMELASGAVAAGGSLGMLIPPSVVFIVYAIMTEQSIGKLFIAGIVPGLLIATLFCIGVMLTADRLVLRGLAGTWRLIARSPAGLAAIREKAAAIGAAEESGPAKAKSTPAKAQRIRPVEAAPAPAEAAKPEPPKVQDKPEQSSKPMGKIASRLFGQSERADKAAHKTARKVPVSNPAPAKPAKRGDYHLPSIDMLMEPTGGYNEAAETHARQRQALLQQTDDWASGLTLDPRYGRQDLFSPGFQGRFLIKFIF